MVYTVIFCVIMQHFMQESFYSLHWNLFCSCTDASLYISIVLWTICTNLQAHWYTDVCKHGFKQKNVFANHFHGLHWQVVQIWSAHVLIKGIWFYSLCINLLCLCIDWTVCKCSNSAYKLRVERCLCEESRTRLWPLLCRAEKDV